MKMSTKDRFERNFRVTPSCWLWQERSGYKGYGTFYAEGKPQGAHRVSYELYKHQIPPGLTVRHRCDNARCVNPEHLELGTQSDNMKDLRERGNPFGGKRVCGEQHHAVKVTIEDTKQIKDLAKCGLFSAFAIGKLYGISRITASRIINNQHWS